MAVAMFRLQVQYLTGGGSMVGNAKFLVRKWYLVMAFMSFSNKGISDSGGSKTF